MENSTLTNLKNYITPSHPRNDNSNNNVCLHESLIPPLGRRKKIEEMKKVNAFFSSNFISNNTIFYILSSFLTLTTIL